MVKSVESTMAVLMTQRSIRNYGARETFWLVADGRAYRAGFLCRKYDDEIRPYWSDYNVHAAAATAELAQGAKVVGVCKGHASPTGYVWQSGLIHA